MLCCGCCGGVYLGPGIRFFDDSTRQRKVFFSGSAHRVYPSPKKLDGPGIIIFPSKLRMVIDKSQMSCPTQPIKYLYK